MQKILLQISVLFAVVSAQFSGLITQTCSNITIRDPTTFPGYSTGCAVGGAGCAKFFTDPVESLLPPVNGADVGKPESDITEGWVTWDTQYVYVMIQSLLQFNGVDVGTQALTPFGFIDLCIDVQGLDTNSDSTNAQCNTLPPRCSLGSSSWDFAFELKYDFASGVIDYSSIHATYLPKLGLGNLCYSGTGIQDPPGFEFWTPNHATASFTDFNEYGANGTTSNPNYPFAIPELRSQTYFKIPLALLGGATYGDVLKIWAYYDNSGPEGDDLAPGDPAVPVPTPAVGATFLLKCDAPKNDTTCGNGVCEAGLENCINCPQDCYGSVDPYDGYVSHPTAKAKGAAPFRGKSKHKSPYKTMTEAPSGTAAAKRKGNPDPKYKGKGKGNGKSGAKNKAWGKGKIADVCCGFFNGTGDGCLPKECRTKFVPTNTPAVAGKAKNAGKGKAAKGKSGKGKGFHVRSPAGKSKGKELWEPEVIGDYQCFNAAPYCGDGICSIKKGEDCQSCPVDCGAIPRWGKAKHVNPGAGKAGPKRRDIVGGKGKGKAVADVCCGGAGLTCADCSASINCNENP